MSLCHLELGRSDQQKSLGSVAYLSQESSAVSLLCLFSYSFLHSVLCSLSSVVSAHPDWLLLAEGCLGTQTNLSPWFSHLLPLTAKAQPFFFQDLCVHGKVMLTSPSAMGSWPLMLLSWMWVFYLSWSPLKISITSHLLYNLIFMLKSVPLLST